MATPSPRPGGPPDASVGDDPVTPTGAVALQGGPDPEPAPAPPGRFRRALGAVAAAVGLSVVFAGALGGAALLHLDAAPTRRIARQITNQVLGSVLEGKIVVDEIDRLGLRGADIRGAAAVDPRGGQVIRVSRLHAEADVLALLYEAALGDGDLSIDIPRIRLEHADVLVEQDALGRFSIEETFTPKPAKKPTTPPRPPKVPPREVRVSLSRIEIGTAWVHGMVAPPRALDGDVSRLVGRVLIGPKGVAVDVEQTGLVERSLMPTTTAGTADYHLRVTIAEKDDVRMWTSFAGQLGKVIVLARGELHDTHLTATADVPFVKPEELASVLPGVPVREPLAARVELDGDIPTFDVTAKVSLHPSATTGGRVQAEGRLDAERARIDVDFTATDLDPRVFGGALPEARIGAVGRARMELAGETPRLAVDARTDAVRVGSQAVPAMDVHLVLDRGELSGNVHLYEQGMPTDASFVLVPKDGLRFEGESEIPSISAAPRIAGPVSGSARVHVAGVVRGTELDARVDGSVSSLRTGGDIRLGHGQVSGRVSGPLDALSVEATLSGSRMHAGGYDFSKVRARASGPVTSPRLHAVLTDEDDGVVTASGTLDPRAAAVKRVHVSLERDGDEVKGEIASIGARGGGVAIEGIKLEGDAVGSATGALQVRNGDVTGKLRGDGVDLKRLTSILGVKPSMQGIANVDIALERGKTGRSGHVKIELEQGEVSLLRGVSAFVTATFKDDAVQADALVRLVAKGDDLERPEDRCQGTIAQVRMDGGEGVLRGPLLEAKTWAGLTGKVKIAAEDWDLRCLARLAPLGMFVSDVRGKVTTRFQVERAPADRFASIRDLYFRTRGLEIAGPQGFGADRPEWESRQVDVQIKGELDGRTGAARANATLFDGQILGDLGLGAELDLPTLADHPERRAASLRASRLTGSVSIPRRPVNGFSTLPTFVKEHLPPMSGEIRADGYVEGTIDRPFVALRLLGWKLAHAQSRSPEGASPPPPAGVNPAGAPHPPSDPRSRSLERATPSPWSIPLDVDALVAYDSKHATLTANVTKDGVGLASANASVEADLHRLLAPRKPGERAPWTGDFNASLSELPLSEVPFFADREIGGKVTGKVAMTRLNDRPTLSVDLELPDLRIGNDLFFERGAFSLHIVKVPGVTPEQQIDRAVAKAELVAQGGGRLDAAAYAGVRWTDGIAPTIDSAQPADVYAKADMLRLTALQPFVTPLLSKLDGFLDGELRFGWSRLTEGEKGSLTADLEVKEGVFHIPQVGQELRNAHVRIIANPAGALRLDDIRADGVSGRITGWALARLDGLRFVDAGGELVIRENEEIPLTLEGVPVGRARGKFRVDAEKKDEQIKMKVAVSGLDLELPSSSSRDVQSLDDNPDISVSHAVGAAKEARADDALRWRFVFDLGRSRVHSADIDIHVAGAAAAPPTVEITDKVRVSGDIHIQDGTFGVYGKKFEFQENGLVRLRPEEAGNPYLNVTARWRAPDQSDIFVDYVGVLHPISPQKLKFRSASLTDREALAMVLFGADATKSGTRTGGEAAGGVVGGAAGDLAASQFNTLLAGIAPLSGLSTRIGTSEQGAMQTTVSWDVGDTVTAEATVEGSPSQQTQTTTTGGAGTKTGRQQVGIDWRFYKSWWGTWSVRGTLGRDNYDQPTSGVDLLWQYRY